MPFIVELLIGIIPVSYFKQRFHGHSRHQFQCCSADTARYIGQKNIILKGHGNHKHHNRPTSVNRQEWSSHKTAVHKFLTFNRYIGGLKNPAKKAIKIKEK